MPYAFIGTGTTFCGKRDFEPDGSFLTTEWVVIFCVPIFPIQSFRVRYLGPAPRRVPIGFGSSESYAVSQRTTPNRKQVLCVYGFAMFFIAWMGATFGFVVLNIENPYVAPYLFFLSCLLPAPVPWLLRTRANRATRKTGPN